MNVNKNVSCDLGENTVKSSGASLDFYEFFPTPVGTPGGKPLRLTEEIKIGPQMIGMIEKSASLARTAEAAARQRRQRYDDG